MHPRIALPVAVAVAALALASCEHDPTSASRPVPRAARFDQIPTTVLGLVTHTPGDNEGYIARDLNDLGIGADKISFIRADIPWWDWEKRHKAGDDYYHDIVVEQVPAGVQVLAVLGYRYNNDDDKATHLGSGPEFTHCLTTWRPSMECVPDAVPGDTIWDDFFADWKSFVDSVITENPEIHFWESWNEPEPEADNYNADGGGWFYGRDWQLDSLISSLCRIAHAHLDYCVGPAAGIHDGAPSAPIVNSYVQWVVNRANADGVDIISVHMYRPTSDIAAIAPLFAADGRGSKKLWVTETGHISPNIAQPAHDPELQERGVAEEVTEFRGGQLPGIDGIFLYDLQSEYGGLDDDFKLKRPAYYALQKILAGSYQSPAPGLCSNSTATPTLCDYKAGMFTVAPNQAYTALLTVRAVDQTVALTPGMSVTLYYTDSIAETIGTKQTDVNGNATFRVDRNKPAYTVSVAGMPNGTYTLAPLATSSFGSITYSQTDTTHYRTFMLAHGTCYMRAEVMDSDGNPVNGAVLGAYQGSQFLAQYTTSNGMTPLVPGNCQFLHGFQVVSLPLRNRQRGSVSPNAISTIFRSVDPFPLDNLPAAASPMVVYFTVTYP